MARTSSPAFEQSERPTAKRDRPDAVDLANAANRTQKLNPRELLGDKLDGEPASSAAPRQTTSGMRAVVTPEQIDGFVLERRAEGAVEPTAAVPVAPSVDPLPLPPLLPALPPRRARFVALHDGRVVFTPAFVAFAVIVALVIGIVVGRLR